MSTPASPPVPPALRWTDVEAADPGFAAAVLARFTATKHHVLASLTRDGSPRVWGTEVDLWRGDLLLGSMVPARKVDDLRRDPRFALHANPGDGSMTGGDAKLAGRAVEVTDEALVAAYADERHPPPPFVLFRLDLTSVVLTEVDGEVLRIRSLAPAGPVRTVTR